MKRIIAYLESIPSLRRLGMAVSHFLKHNLMSHASALCYSSILGAVPILAIVMAIARGFGFGQLIEEKIANIAALSSEMAETVMSFVNNYLEYARGGVFVGIGLLLHHQEFAFHAVNRFGSFLNKSVIQRKAFHDGHKCLRCFQLPGSFRIAEVQ